MSRLLSVLVILLPMLVDSALGQTAHNLQSPDGRISVVIDAGDVISYSVSLNGTPLLRDATLSLTVDEAELGIAPDVQSVNERSVDDVVEPVVRIQSAELRDQYNELRLEMEGGYAVAFRAYDEGVAYRFETSLPENEVTVYDEQAGFNFAGAFNVYYPSEESFFSHNERAFIRYALPDLVEDSLASIPVVVEAADGVRIAISDSDVEEYPGLWFRGTGGNSMVADFPPYPLEETLEGDRNFAVTRGADYIARTRGTRTYPWRVLAIEERDADLVINPMVYLLASPSRIEDPSWIRPGKVAWDWYNYNNIYGVDFEAGVNTETYKYYIDFAADHGLEYVILDEGWYVLGDLLDVVPEMDVAELIRYGEERGVGIVLWVVAKTLDDQLEEALDQFESWGVKGIKVDFMQRDDQLMMDFYHEVSREAADRQLLVNYHGAIRPAVLARTWPNMLSVEGVRGLEQNKWSALSHPEHNVTIPFTRMMVGPMDYTPGAMLNAAQEDFAEVFRRPMSMGTRVHQLAMYVVYESPMQMLADSPSNYLREPEALQFLAPVPSTWDETLPLDGEIGEYVVVARRSGDDWYVGAMSNWTPREVELDLSFLPEGSYQMDAFADGVNAHRYGGDYRREQRLADRSERLTLTLASGGGWVARFSRVR